MEKDVTPQFKSELKAFLEAVNLKYDFDFRHYSFNSMVRTVSLGMERLGCDKIETLQSKVLANSDCFHDLLQSLTIPVSEMFRDPSYFKALREKVIPSLRTYPSVKVWVAGCGTGEEVYSLAILLLEEKLLERTTIYATDINPRILESAKQGVYSLKILPDYAENYLKSGGKKDFTEYYIRNESTFCMDPKLKANITFADHSLATDAVFSETQFISCRNVLIYFDRQLQNRAFKLFYESLCRKGFLGLGSKETIQFSQYASHFDALVKKDRIFQKND